MAQPDLSILQGIRPVQIDTSRMESPVNQMANMYQLQSAQQANQLNALKLQEMQRAANVDARLKQLYSRPDFDVTSPDAAREVMSISPATGMSWLAEARKAEQERATVAEAKAKTDAANYELKRKKLDQAIRDIASFNSLDEINAHMEQKIASGELPADKAAVVRATLPKDDSGVSAWKANTLRGLLSVKDQMELDKPVVVPAGSSVFQGGESVFTAPEKAPAMQLEYELAKKEGFKGTFFDFKRKLAEAGRQPPQPTAPVAVVDPVTGKAKYVSREQAISGGMTPASAQESLPPKEIQKREAAYPQATSAIKGFEAKSESFVKDLKALRDHPGLSEITGMIAGRAPGVTKNGRAAQALYDKIMAKGGFEALQQMREASKTGGALGNVSNQEGKQLQASFAAIDRRQDAADVKKALDTAISDVEGARTRMREAYDTTYEYKSSREGAAPRPSGAGGKSAEDPLGIR